MAILLSLSMIRHRLLVLILASTSSLSAWLHPLARCPGGVMLSSFHASFLPLAAICCAFPPWFSTICVGGGGLQPRALWLPRLRFSCPSPLVSPPVTFSCFLLGWSASACLSARLFLSPSPPFLAVDSVRSARALSYMSFTCLSLPSPLPLLRLFGRARRPWCPSRQSLVCV